MRKINGATRRSSRCSSRVQALMPQIAVADGLGLRACSPSTTTGSPSVQAFMAENLFDALRAGDAQTDACDIALDIKGLFLQAVAPR
jgi:hypothetical protein